MGQDEIKQMADRIVKLQKIIPSLSGQRLTEALTEIHELNKRIRKIRPVFYGGFLQAEEPQPKELDDKSRQEIEIIISRYRQKLITTISLCESPIERLLGMWIYYLTNGQINLNPQRKITTPDGQTFRVDFLIDDIIVECDGYDFHDKTKEQATMDKQRDRLLKSVGYEVIRFSGSEIWGNPEKCAKEVIELLKNLGSKRDIK